MNENTSCEEINAWHKVWDTVRPAAHQSQSWFFTPNMDDIVCLRRDEPDWYGLLLIYEPQQLALILQNNSDAWTYIIPYF